MIAAKKRHLLEGMMEEDPLFIIRGKEPTLRNGDVEYPFRQDSDFLLLTGLDVPSLSLIARKKDGQTTWTLYSDPISDHEIVWGTSRLGYEELTRISGISDIRSTNEFENDLRESIYASRVIYARDEMDIPKEKYRSIDTLLKPIRMKKEDEEIEYMREAIRVTKIAHDRVRESLTPGMYEYEIEAIIASVYRSHHMTEAYPSIVASGPNACTLHYTRHDRKIEQGDIVLVDAGAEYRGYAADITRVSVVGGEESRSKRQEQVYHSVMRTKEYAESLIRPGIHRLEYEKLVREFMNSELVGLGLIPEGASSELRDTLSRKYYPHSTSHFLGLDVHDTGGREEIFAPGMVITCEPGIYIREEGIGVRLEDDILITPTGCENLSESIAL